MRLVERGIDVDPAGPTLNLYPDGAHYSLGDDMEANVEETKRFSPADARALPVFEDDLPDGPGRAAGFNMTAPDPRIQSPRRSARAREDGAGSASSSASTSPTSRSCSPRAPSRSRRAVRQRAREGRAGLARDQRQRRRAVDTRDRVRPAARPRQRGGGRRRPPMGVRAGWHGRADRDDGRCRARGRVRRSAATPRSSRCSRGRSSGRRTAGERRGDPRPPRAVERRPQAHVPVACATDADLPEDFVREIGAYRCMGTSIKINLGVGGCRTRGPARGRRAAVPPRDHGGEPVHRRTWTSSRRRRRTASPPDPSHIELCFPTVHDPSLAPEGKHIVTIDVNSQPYHLRERRGTTSRRTAPTARSPDRASTSRSCPT